jgi:hypothetical protein
LLIDKIEVGGPFRTVLREVENATQNPESLRPLQALCGLIVNGGCLAWSRAHG